MTKKRLLRIVSTTLTAALLTSTGLALAESRPYFVANDGDVFTGGWFYDNAGNCDTDVTGPGATYQAPDYGNLSNTRYDGAIMAFGTDSPRAGARDNLDAFALGMIEGGAGNYGFYTGLSGSSDLSFSNVAPTSPQTNSWGGFFEGNGAKPDHCIPDYWAKRNGAPDGTPPAAPRGSVDLNAPEGNYLVSGDTTINGDTISPISATDGRNLAYFVDGDVTINGNILYGPRNASNVPKFVLVASGNIYIKPGVTQLDGWYIAQPTSGTTDGVIWTCIDPGNSDGAPPTPKDTWVRSNCNSPLTVNGAFTAKQVNLLRINGGLNSAAPPGPAAEVFNYTPEMVIGGPFFNAPPGQGSGLDSLISLPPVF